jgi:hypothetical protein
MDRFKILKGMDPFAKNPQGDFRKYIISGVKYRGWLVDDGQSLEGTCPYPASVVLKIPDNFLKFVTVLKKLEIEIESKNKFEIFVGKCVKNSSYDGPFRALFIGEVVKIRTPNYTLGQ